MKRQTIPLLLTTVLILKFVKFFVEFFRWKGEVAFVVRSKTCKENRDRDTYLKCIIINTGRSLKYKTKVVNRK